MVDQKTNKHYNTSYPYLQGRKIASQKIDLQRYGNPPAPVGTPNTQSEETVIYDHWLNLTFFACLHTASPKDTDQHKLYNKSI